MLSAIDYRAMASEHLRLACMCRSPESREHHLRLAKQLQAIADREEHSVRCAPRSNAETIFT
jgi:hypothetical protein